MWFSVDLDLTFVRIEGLQGADEFAAVAEFQDDTFIFVDYRFRTDGAEWRNRKIDLFVHTDKSLNPRLSGALHIRRVSGAEGVAYRRFLGATGLIGVGEKNFRQDL